MRSLIIAILGVVLIFDYCQGDAMDPSRIRQLIKQVDDSLVRGNIYCINYQVCQKRTEAYYAHKKQVIQMLGEMATNEENNTPPAQQDAAFVDKQATYHQVIRQYKKDLSDPREMTIFSVYSLDGTGFYLKQSMTYIDSDGKAGSNNASITVSDGKIMGSFYLDQAQAVIQPATERPQVGTPEWTDTAYLFRQNTLSTYISNYPNLSLKEEEGDLVVTGDKQIGPIERGHAELRINKATLVPESLIFLYYNKIGVLHQKLTKTWEYQNVSGCLLPKCVTEREYNAILNVPPELEKERILTVNQFNPIPINAKAEFAKLLKLNLSVFDEITGTHYMSGDPGSALDKLSQ